MDRETQCLGQGFVIHIRWTEERKYRYLNPMGPDLTLPQLQVKPIPTIHNFCFIRGLSACSLQTLFSYITKQSKAQHNSDSL